MQRVRLVERHFEHASDDLHRPCETARGCQHEGERGRGETAGGGGFGNDGLGRGLVHFEHEARAGCRVGIAQLVEQRLATSECAPRARRQRVEGALAFAIGQAPAGVLAREAGQHRIHAGDLHLSQSEHSIIAGHELHTPQSAHADLCHEAPCLQSAGHGDAGIDDPGALRGVAHRDPVHISSRDELLHQRAGQSIDARCRHRAIAHGCCSPGKEGSGGKAAATVVAACAPPAGSIAPDRRADQISRQAGVALPRSAP